LTISCSGGAGIDSDDLGLGFKDLLARLDREQTQIIIRLETRRFGKPTTIVEGINMENAELERLSSKLKKKLATGGSVKDGRILLQGDHRKSLPAILVDLGFPQRAIQVI
jgi:translation initiation factor 1